MRLVSKTAVGAASLGAITLAWLWRPDSFKNGDSAAATASPQFTTKPVVAFENGLGDGEVQSPQSFALVPNNPAAIAPDIVDLGAHRVGEPELAVDPTLKNLGFTTPEDALHSHLWAISTGEIGILARHIALDSNAQSKAEMLFADLPPESQKEFGSPREMVAFMLIADSAQVAGWQTTMRSEGTSNEVLFNVRVDTVDHEVRRWVVRLVPTDNGWARIVTGNLIQTWRRLLEVRDPTGQLPRTPGSRPFGER